MNVAEEFARFHVSAWLSGDGVTSRHLVTAVGKGAHGRFLRKGKIAAAAFVIGTAAAFSSPSELVVSFGRSVDTLGSNPAVNDTKSHQASVFEHNSRNILSQLHGGLSSLYSPETMALATRAMNRKDDLGGKSVQQWAESLTTPFA